MYVFGEIPDAVFGMKTQQCEELDEVIEKIGARMLRVLAGLK